MSDYGQRLIIDAGFEATVGAVCRAIRDEGLQLLTRTDVRERFCRELNRRFRNYVLIEAWSPDTALEALQDDLDVGAVLPARFTVYEVTERQTAVVVTEPMAPLADQPTWRERRPELAAIADRERTHVSGVIARLLRNHRQSAAPMSGAADGAAPASPQISRGCRS